MMARIGINVTLDAKPKAQAFSQLLKVARLLSTC
jgi:hypothetical protein